MESLDRARHQHLSRRLLEELEQQLAAADDIRALREKRPEAVGRSMMAPLALLDSRLENAVYQSLRRPLDSQATSETMNRRKRIEANGVIKLVQTGNKTVSSQHQKSRPQNVVRSCRARGRTAQDRLE